MDSNSWVEILILNLKGKFKRNNLCKIFGNSSRKWFVYWIPYIFQIDFIQSFDYYCCVLIIIIFSKVFAPNILHCVKPGQRSEVSAERAEERIDVINVVRALLEHATTLFTVPAALLDEVYLHMMDTHPADLDLALSRRVEEWVSETEWRFSIFNLLSQKDTFLKKNLWWQRLTLSRYFGVLKSFFQNSTNLSKLWNSFTIYLLLHINFQVYFLSSEFEKNHQKENLPFFVFSRRTTFRSSLKDF